MDDVFNPGDVVRLKSGGPLMTVDSSRNDDEYVWCDWFDVSGTVCHGNNFKRVQLIHDGRLNQIEKALEFYASPETWLTKGHPQIDADTADIVRDRGRTAREALKKQ